MLLIGGTSVAVGGQAFAVANELPTNVYDLVAGGLLGAILVPEIVRSTKAPGGGDLDRLLTLTIVGALLLTLALTWLAPALVRGFA